ncbi:MAG: hypothetical protein ISEC1_P1020 [Thiomicrorhabdus sp.]|nr:MAG: hypothetical protein ISEC1_P1020 [Thiomicrorhabdus sp.]
MKKALNLALSTVLLGVVTVPVQASWLSDAWQGTKEVASSTWDSTSDKAVELKDDAADSEVLDDVKKLGEADTYRKAWEGIKESASNPSEVSRDEHGLFDE